MPQGFVSLHGRRIGLTSTGGIGQYLDSTGGGSSAVTLYSQMWGPALHTDVASSVGSTIQNAGIVTMTSASATAVTGHEIAAPVKGVELMVHIDTSASEVSLGSTSTAIVFASTVAAAAGSTLFAAAANLAGTVVTLRGRSTAEWLIVGSTTNLAVG